VAKKPSYTDTKIQVGLELRVRGSRTVIISCSAGNNSPYPGNSSNRPKLEESIKVLGPRGALYGLPSDRWPRAGSAIAAPIPHSLCGTSATRCNVDSSCRITKAPIAIAPHCAAPTTGQPRIADDVIWIKRVATLRQHRHLAPTTLSGTESVARPVVEENTFLRLALVKKTSR
jgi:hypothetical protein